MVQMKEQIKAPEKIQLSDEEIANLSDEEFKTLVIRMPTEILSMDTKQRKKCRLCQVKYRKIYREPTVKGRKLGLISMMWSRRKK